MSKEDSPALVEAVDTAQFNQLFWIRAKNFNCEYRMSPFETNKALAGKRGTNSNGMKKLE